MAKGCKIYVSDVGFITSVRAGLIACLFKDVMWEPCSTGAETKMPGRIEIHI